MSVGSVILRVPAARSSLTLLDLPGMSVRRLENDDDRPLVHSEFVSFFPDSRRIVFAATDLTLGHRIYCQDLAGGKPVCFTPDEVGVRMPWNRAVSPDGAGIVLKTADDRLCLYPVSGGPATPLDGLGRGFQLLGWHGNAQELFVSRAGGLPLVVGRGAAPPRPQMPGNGGPASATPTSAADDSRLPLARSAASSALSHSATERRLALASPSSLSSRPLSMAKPRW